MTPFKTIWPDFYIVYLILSIFTQLTPHRKTIWPNFIIVYPIDSFQDYMTWLLHCIPKWLLSWPFDLILSRCTHLTPFKTISANFIIVYPIDSFQDHLTCFLYSTPNWLLSRPYDWFLYCVPNWLLSRSYNLISSLCTLITSFKTI